MACIRFSRESAQHRKDLICWLGQPVRITVETLPGQDGGLVVLALTPLEGFIHLVADPADCIKQYGPYHVSLCQKALVSQSDLDELREAWDGQEVTLPISCVRGEGCMELDACPLTESKLIRTMHDQPDAWYKDRTFQISG